MSRGTERGTHTKMGNKKSDRLYSETNKTYRAHLRLTATCTLYSFAIFHVEHLRVQLQFIQITITLLIWYQLGVWDWDCGMSF